MLRVGADFQAPRGNWLTTLQAGAVGPRLDCRPRTLEALPAPLPEHTVAQVALLLVGVGGRLRRVVVTVARFAAVFREIARCQAVLDLFFKLGDERELGLFREEILCR